MDYNKIQANLTRRGYIPYFAATKEEAKTLVMDEILKDVKTIGKGGSNSLKESGIWDALVERDARTDDSRIEMFSTTLYIQKGLDPDVALEKGMTADAYICSSNVMTEKGTFINIDGIGNRVGAMIYGPKKIVLIVGKNKIHKTFDEAWDYLKNVACQLHAKRHENVAYEKAGKCVDCDNEHRMCRITSIMDWALPEREYHIVLVDEHLGY
ncbi:MAG: lactate utilization protein [Christensenellaceae bacterium]|jgi:L-lactate utilization protein LutB